MGLLDSFIIAMGLNILMFIPAFIFKTDKLTDLSYGVSFALVAVIVFFQNSFDTSKLLLLVMILLWSIRIGGFLFIRIRKMKRDKRFDGIRESFIKFLGFWLLQGFTVWIVLFPSILFFSEQNVSITTLSVVGLVMWFSGLVIETIADKQKYEFLKNSDNKGRWIDGGLWHYSRHPNYFGEITHWLGVYLFVVSSLSGVLPIIALIGPIYLAWLIIFVSGIPKLERYADDRWGDDPNYVKYKKRTSNLIPLPTKK